MAALLKAPPTNKSYNPNSVFAELFLFASARIEALMPGSVIWAPILTTINNAIVKIILDRSSSILKIFLKFSTKPLILLSLSLQPTQFFQEQTY